MFVFRRHLRKPPPIQRVSNGSSVAAAAVKRYDSLSSESHACHSRIYVHTHHAGAESNAGLREIAVARPIDTFD